MRSSQRRRGWRRSGPEASPAPQIGSANASRAVGLANGRNPIAVIVPCHRVIGASGKLVGYGGGLGRKKTLLELEAGVAESEGEIVLPVQ